MPATGSSTAWQRHSRNDRPRQVGPGAMTDQDLRDLPSRLAVRIPCPELGDWRTGNTGVAGFWSFAAPRPGPHLLLTSLLHGNEIAGAAAVLRLLEHGVRPRVGRLTLGFANLDAFDQFDTRSPTSSRFLDEDMNRVWSAEHLDGCRRSIELDRARQLRPLVHAADVLLDLHSMLWDSEPLVLCGMTDASRRLAMSLGVPTLVIADKGHTGGPRLIDYAHFAQGQRRALLVEAGQHWQAETIDTALAAAGALLIRLGMACACDLEGVVPVPVPHGPPRFATVTRTVTAEHADFAFVQNFRGGEIVEKRNTLIALDGHAEIRTPHDRCLLVMPSLRPVPGHTAVRLARFVEPQ